MILAGHQPEYLPYLGYIYKMMKADKFIIVDHVQYLEKGFQNSNRVRTGPGSNGFSWLTIPVVTHDRRYQPINEVIIDNSTAWAKKHWKTIYLNYKSAPYFAEHEAFFKNLYEKKWDKLSDLSEAVIYYLAEKLNLTTPLFLSSKYDFKEKKNDLIIEMCRALGADTYLSGQGAKTYVEEEKLKARGINHIFSDFKHPVYPQKYKPFVPNLSAIDLLFNCGPESAGIIKNSNEKNSEK